MHSPSSTILEAIATQLRSTAHGYFPGVEEAPVCVLRADADSVWQPIISLLRNSLVSKIAKL